MHTLITEIFGEKLWKQVCDIRELHRRRRFLWTGGTPPLTQ